MDDNLDVGNLFHSVITLAWVLWPIAVVLCIRWRSMQSMWSYSISGWLPHLVALSCSLYLSTKAYAIVKRNWPPK